MTDILSLRTTMRASKATLDDANALLRIFRKELAEGSNAPPPLKAFLQQQVSDQIDVVTADRDVFNANAAIYQAAVIADPMHAANPALPLVLLPIRIETAYFPTEAGMDLVVRVYPDDIHVDTHEPELTTAELAAGSAYWRAAWGAGPNQARLDAAWKAIVGQLKQERAAWSVRALQPAIPRPLEETPADQTQPEPPLSPVDMRPSTFNRPARTSLLPDHWRMVGLRKTDGSEIFYAEGSKIPDTLDLSFAPPEEGMRGAGSPDADLPFHDGSRWLVNLDAAIAAGMAVRIPLTGPDFRVDQLFVLGVSAATPPDEGAARLESALIAHQYTNGLAFLPLGASTNNTAKTRSAWESAPNVPSPGELNTARAGYQPGSQQNAAVTARALGVDGTEVLSVAPHALDDQQSGIAAVQQHLWPALGGRALSWIYTTWDIPPGGTPAQGTWTPHIDLPFAQALQAHAAGWMRSRGTLPALRVGNQPYGLLPALSMDDWVIPATDPLAGLVPVLRNLRTYWSASVTPFSYVKATPDSDADNTVVNILRRLPVSVDIRVRPEADPVQHAVANLPVVPILGLATNSKLFLAGPPNDLNPEVNLALPLLPVDVVHDGPGDQHVLLLYQELLHDGIAVLEQMLSKEQFTAKYEDLFAGKPIPGAPPPDLFISLILDAFFNPLISDNTNALHSEADFIVVAARNADFANADFVHIVQNALPTVKAFVARFDGLCLLDPKLYEGAIRETLDVFSHRLDAWITSLAARRLDEMRAAQGTGVVLGAYGWVENITPRRSIPDQHYIHAPSMGHAATVAVLRGGYESHANAGSLAVNLVSSRVRKADWLAAGVRSGQTVGALLGYRFERGLQEAGLARLIFSLRKNHPLPTLPVAKADQNGPASLEAVAVRNVVDGLDLVRKQASVKKDELSPLTSAAELDVVSGLLTDLADVLDSFGDLLLAESVHHLVAGNPLRAGLTADTAGRGEPVPDRFDVTQTPRSARPLTWQLGVLMPGDFRSVATGWRTERPRAAAEPHAEAWAATMLGPAESWLISCTLATPQGKMPATITLDTMLLCTLDVVAECAGDPSQLERRIIEAISTGMPAGTGVSISRAPNPDGSPGFGELLSLTKRIRAVFGRATALTPQHLQGADSSLVAGIDVSELDTRAAALGSSLAAAVQALDSAAAALTALAGADDAAVLDAVQSLRSALIGIANHGVPAAWPVGAADSEPSNVAALSAQAGSLLNAVRPLVDKVRPAPPDANAEIPALTAWLGAVKDYVQGIIGAGIPLLPVYQLPRNSLYGAAFAAEAAPLGAGPAAVMVWLRRVARLRSNAAALHDLLLAAEMLQAAPAGLTVAQVPANPGGRWAALPFPEGAPPNARIGLVFSTPAHIDPAAAFCGFVCDAWTEQLPGVTSVATNGLGYEASEVTGMAFKFDTPAAAAPQALLLAVAPDPAHGWSFDILLDTVKETLDLARIRPVVLEELYRYGRVLPAIHTSAGVDGLLSDAAKIQAAGGDL